MSEAEQGCAQMRDARAEAALAGRARQYRTATSPQSRRAARGTPTRRQHDAVIGIPPSTRWTRRCAAECDARRGARLAEATARRVCRRMSRTRGPEAQAQALGRVARRRESKEARRRQAVTLWSPFCSAGVEHPACLTRCGTKAVTTLSRSAPRSAPPAAASEASTFLTHLSTTPRLLPHHSIPQQGCFYSHPLSVSVDSTAGGARPAPSKPSCHSPHGGYL